MTQLTAGKPEPLGAHFDGKGVNFTLFSAHAERVELCVFDGEGNEHRYDLPARTGIPARLPGRRTARYALWLSRSRSVGSRAGALV